MRYAPIDTVNPDRDVLRCLPESLEQKLRLLDYQGAFGIGAYDNGVFVGSLWFYRIEDAELGNPFAPAWSGWHRGNAEYARLSPRALGVETPVLGLSCFHVGRTKTLEAEDRNDESYYGKGIGAGLLAAALDWAAAKHYRSIATTSGIDVFPEFNTWAGTLPLKVYLRRGFGVRCYLDTMKTIPEHLRALAGNHSQRDLVQAIVSKSMNEQAE